jgi:hypothetical protein
MCCHHPIGALVLLLAGGIVCAAPVFAARPGPEGKGPANRASAGARKAGDSSISGVAWDHTNSPLPYARLRLRNTVTGHIEAMTSANEYGRFSFTGVEGGNYVIELVNEMGKVLTLGNVFTVAAGETLTTVLHLNTRVPWFRAFFGNTASAVAATAAATGVTALAPEKRKATPNGGS